VEAARAEKVIKEEEEKKLSAAKKKAAAPTGGRFGQSYGVTKPAAPVDFNYSKWDHLADSDDSDDDPTPPGSAGHSLGPSVGPVRGVAPPAPSNPLEAEMLKDPRLLEASRLIELGQKTGDMEMLKKAEQLTHEALAAKGMSPEQITRMLGTAPVSAAPAPGPKTKAAKKKAQGVKLPEDKEAMKCSLTSGIQELENKQMEIDNEQKMLQQIAESGGPEDFFNYMRSQGMTEDDIMKIMSGDKSVMEQAVAQKAYDLDEETRASVARVEEVSQQVDALRKGDKTAEEVRIEEEARLGGNSTPEPVGVWKASDAGKASEKGGIEVPGYSIEPSDNALVITIKLPNVVSVSEIDKDVSRTSLELEVSDLYKLNVRLPQAVDEDEVSAKWVKSDRKLILTCELE